MLKKYAPSTLKGTAVYFHSLRWESAWFQSRNGIPATHLALESQMVLWHTLLRLVDELYFDTFEAFGVRQAETRFILDASGTAKTHAASIARAQETRRAVRTDDTNTTKETFMT